MKKRKFVAAVMAFSMLLGQTVYAQELAVPTEALEVSDEAAAETVYETEPDTGYETEDPYETETGENTEKDIDWNHVTGELHEGSNIVEISETGTPALVSFVPSESGEYEIYSTGDDDTKAELYDSDQHMLTDNDDGGENQNFKLSFRLEAGKTYYIAARYFYAYMTGTMTLVVEKGEERPIAVVNEGENTVEIAEAGKGTWVSFVPEKSAEYDIYSTGTEDTKAELYDSEKKRLAENDDADGENNRNFKISYTLEAGKVYYIVVRYYNDSMSGNLTVMIERGKEVEQPEQPEQPYLVLNEGENVVEVAEAGKSAWTSFTTDKTGEYRIYSTGDEDARAILYNADKEVILDSYDEENSGNFDFYSLMEADRIYYLEVCYMDDAKTGSIHMNVDRTSTDDQCGYDVTWERILSYLFLEGTGGLYPYYDNEPWRDEWRSNLIDRLYIKEGITDLVTATFKENGYLQLVQVPSTLKEIPANCFYNCSRLDTVTIPEGVQEIGRNAFEECRSLKKLEIPASVTKIGADAFKNCADGFCIESVKGSAAEAYAEENNITFVAKDQPEASVSLEDCQVTLAEKIMAYDGSEREPQVNVKDGDQTLVEGQDYTVSYANNVNVGTASVTVTGNGTTYTGEVTSEFQIVEVADEIKEGENYLRVLVNDDVQNETYEFKPAEEGYYTFKVDFFENTGVKLKWDGFGTRSRWGNYNSNKQTLEIISYSKMLAGGNNYRFTVGANAAVDTVIKIVAEKKETSGEINGVTWNLSEDGVLTVDGSDLNQADMDGWNDYVWENFKPEIKKIVIGNQVTCIPYDAFNDCFNALSLELPEGLTEIQNTAFLNCEQLVNVELPASLKSVGSEAFKTCGLKSIEIPESVETIGEYAFGYYGSALSENFYIIGKVGSAAETYANENNIKFIDKDQQAGVTWNLENGVLTISGKGAMDSYGKAASQPWYQNRAKVTSVIIEDGITEIGNFAFYGLTNMKNITIADSVTKIGAYAFKNCTALTDIQLPKSLETIGDSAFYSCTGLASVTFPESVTFIDGYAFARCTGIKQITFEGDAPEIKAGAFSGVKADVDYPKENATWTNDKKQNYGGQLTWEKSEPWEIKDHVLTINDDSVMADYDSAKKTPWYANRDEITSIVVSDGVTKVGAFAFYGLSNLTSVTLSDTVASIGGYAFKNCVKLTDINLPTGMKKIGESAFYGCSSLKSITIPEGLYTIWAYTFKNCTSLSEVNLPSTLIKIDEAAFYGCTSLEKIDIPDNVSIIGIYCFKNCTKLSDIKLPKKLTQIREAAFYSCTSLANVTVPEKVESIGNYAFRRCEGLKSITLPETLKTIGESAFYGCSNLSEFALPEGLTSLGDYAFKNCIKVKEINLPALLTTIGASTFYGCTGLTSITIPEKVTAIGAYAFSSCSNLKEVLFTGDAPEIGAYAFSRVTANVYYPADNDTWIGDKIQNYGGKLNWIKN